MRSTDPLAGDVTAEAAAANVAGDMVFSVVLGALGSELDQVLIITHVALGIPLAPLARDLQVDRRELQARVDRVTAELSQAGMRGALSGIQRAGQIEHYYPIIARLGLQDWFCARPGCTNLIAQAKTGRPRKTCSGRCRSRIHRGKGLATQERIGDDLLPEHETPSAEDARLDTNAMRTLMLQLMRPINYPPPFGHWNQQNIHCRDRALLLLGFTGPTPVNVIDLHDLDIEDVKATPAEVEIRLYKKRQDRATQYFKITGDDDLRLSVAHAMTSWCRVLRHSGRTAGPLFLQLGKGGHFLKESRRLSGNAVADVIWQSLESWGIWSWSREDYRLGESRPVVEFLYEIMGDIDFPRAVSRPLDLEPDEPLGGDPCERSIDWLSLRLRE
jgi:hypothetical protein